MLLIYKINKVENYVLGGLAVFGGLAAIGIGALALSKSDTNKKSKSEPSNLYLN
jgi:hypothetical protein